MKKLLIAIMVAVLPVCVEAQGLFSNKVYQGRKDHKEYMQGAVPQADGKVVFTKEFTTSKNSYNALMQWAGLRYKPDTEQGKWSDLNYFHNTESTKVETPDKNTIVCQGNEWLVFARNVLSSDQSIVRYKLTLKITNMKVVARLTDIAYFYALNEMPELIYAEDWIVDSKAFNEKGKLRHSVDKFRVKTIDLVDELFAEIESTLK